MSIQKRINDILEQLDFDKEIQLETNGVKNEAEANWFKRKIELQDYETIKKLTTVLNFYGSIILFNDDVIDDYFELLETDGKDIGQINFNIAFTQYYSKHFDEFINKTYQFLIDKYSEKVFEIENNNNCNLKELKDIFDIVQFYFSEKEKDNKLTFEKLLKK